MKTAWIRNQLRQSGFEIQDTAGPIVAINLNNRTAAARLEKALLRSGILPPRIHYPGIESEGCFRFVISTEHSTAQLQALVKALTPLCRRK